MIKKSTTCDLIVEDLKKNIINGILRPGDKLPTERELAEEYGVSRLPVREALRVLREIGLLETKHGKGTYIKGISSHIFSKDIASYLMMHKRTVLEVFQLRKILEIDVARLAAINANSDDINKIKTNMEYAEQEILKLKQGKPNDFLSADAEFHSSIVQASHNSVLKDVILGIQEVLTLHQILSLSATDPLDDVIKYHRRIEKAIESGNENEAQEAMRNHMERIEELLQIALEKQNLSKVDHE